LLVADLGLQVTGWGLQVAGCDFRDTGSMTNDCDHMTAFTVRTKTAFSFSEKPIQARCMGFYPQLI